VLEDVIVHWFQEQLVHLGIKIKSILDIFTNGEALIAIIKRYRNDLVDYTPHQKSIDENAAMENNECAFEIFKDEYSIPKMVRVQ
jgi:hypothetical protein